MKSSRLSQQLSDLFTYLLIPGVAVFVPASFSRWILRRASRWRWYMAAAADAAFQGARNYVAIEDEAAFKRRWKQGAGCRVRDAGYRKLTIWSVTTGSAEQIKIIR